MWIVDTINSFAQFVFNQQLFSKKENKIPYDVFTMFTTRGLLSIHPKRIAGEKILENEQFDTIFPPL